jgi:hypothetical protein
MNINEIEQATTHRELEIDALKEKIAVLELESSKIVPTLEPGQYKINDKHEFKIHPNGNFAYGNFDKEHNLTAGVIYHSNWIVKAGHFDSKRILHGVVFDFSMNDTGLAYTVGIKKQREWREEEE